MELPNTAPTSSLYTEHPFPGDGVVRTTGGRIMRAGLQRHAPNLLQRSDLRIADIGCGTGEIIAGYAKLFPQATLTGVDINPPSLKLARSLAERSRLPITFVQANITENLVDRLTEAGALKDRKFDVVSSLGVLHHLSEPAEGFRQVRRIIADDGLFFCYVYSSHGRREDMAVKNLLTEILGTEATFAERARLLAALRIANRDSIVAFLRHLRCRLKFGPPVVLKEMLQLLMKRNPHSHEADTFSNPCEHLYTFGQVTDLCEQTGWKVIGLAEKGGVPTTPEAHTKKPAELEALRKMSPAMLYDYFSFFYRVAGFHFICRPA